MFVCVRVCVSVSECLCVFVRVGVGVCQAPKQYFIFSFNIGGILVVIFATAVGTFQSLRDI